MVMPQRSDLINGCGHHPGRGRRPREDVGDYRDEKNLFRLVESIEEVLDFAVHDLPTDFITTAEMRSGDEGALLLFRYFESGE